MTGLEHAPFVHGEVARHLAHPRLARMGRDAGNADLTGIKFDEERHVEGHQTAQGPHFRAEEVGGPQDRHVAANKFGPRRGLLSAGSGWKASALENIAHGLIADGIAQIGQGTGNAVITPRAILLGHLDDPLFEFLIDSGSAHGLTLSRAIKLPSHQLAMPGQEGLGFDDGGDLSEGLLTEFLTDLGQGSAIPGTP